MYKRQTYNQGFTLLELIIVITIIALIVAVVVAFLGEAGIEGRDATRKTQVQEVIKALELYYTDTGEYPDDLSTTPVDLMSIQVELLGSGYIARMPKDNTYGDSAYQYCVSADLDSFVIMVNTEEDTGITGSDYCHVTRGPGPNYGCDFMGIDIDASESCAQRF